MPRKTLLHLLPLSGAELDRAFIKAQIEDHAHDVQLAQAVQISLHSGKSPE